MEEKVKTFLDEGFDFIEEGFSGAPLEFSGADENIIVESSEGVKSHYHILGTCRGVFQPINEPSRNGRIYETDHWQYQLSKPLIQERLNNRQMLGQIGHRDSRVTDSDLSKGEVSHVVTKMEVKEDAAGKPYLYGELEILDTPAGRNLKALYEGGVGLYISSRGAGKLETIPGNPLKRVVKNSFFLETWDIVGAPGFLKAKPVYEGNHEEEKKAASQPSVSESVNESAEIGSLKEQINKLAMVVEKVVDEIHAPKEQKELTEENKAALLSALTLMTESDISEEAIKEALDVIVNGLKG